VERRLTCDARSDPVSIHSANALAEAAFKRFKKKEDERLDGQNAMAEYEAQRAAVREKAARLRALRLARDEAAKRKDAEFSRRRGLS
jgi:hypothetical protein